ncbi:MAG: phenylalanine--tRNA ligase subunit beta [Planctomycetota bacterium]|nr:MAG: phenylalanine--tRNA ligase subunit beta [Planctomycetota bacterium]
MRTSVKWINDYLDRPADASEQAAVLTAAGLPLDGGDTAENGEIWQEIETTSNRGDCLCHVGMAREIAASTGRSLRPPTTTLVSSGLPARDFIRVTNHEHAMCPRYTARVIRGVTVAASPAWLQTRLIAIGQIPRNNIVDATNFVLFELGQPTHVFDLATLNGAHIHIRKARADEPFLPLGSDAKEIKLTANDLVIADQDRVVALAGVKGGASASVSETTTDVVLEAATFDPIAVRSASRRHSIASDSSYRFERIVHAAQIDEAADRLASLILEIAGGTLCQGVVEAGAPIPEPRKITLRPVRCRAILGFDISTARMMELLATLGFSPRCVGTGASEVIETIAPPRRVDVEREIDLIEEICRLHGLDAIPVADTISVRVPTENPVERGTRAVKDLLVGMGYIETVTHTLIGERAAEPFLMHGAKLLKVDDERAGGEGALRPSVVASLLRVRRHNLDQGAHNLRLFEFASAFHYANGTHVERPTLAMLADMPEGTRDAQIAYRLMRGMVERVLALVVPRSATIAFVKSNEPAWLSSCARIVVDAGRGAIDIGCVGLVDTRILKANGIDRPTAACELQLRTLLAQYPPLNGAVELPAFPASERDISAIVADGVEYAAIEREIVELQLPCLESVQFVTTFRGKQIGEGKKSVSLRLLFRASDRTLRSEEADGAVARAVTQLRDALGAEIRS